MKVCILLHSHWSAGMGGAEYQAKLIFDYLSKKHQVIYLCRNSKEKSDNIVQIKSSSKLCRYAYFPDVPQVYKALKQIQPDVIYHRNGGAYSGVAAYYARRHHVPFVWNLAHDKDIEKVKFRHFRNPLKAVDVLLRRFAIALRPTIIAQTEEQQKMLSQNFAIQNSVHIPNFHPSPNLNLSHLKTEQKASKIILWVANLKPMKDPDLFLELVKYFKDNRDLEFRVAGKADSKWTEKLQQLEKEQSNFTYLGLLTQEEVNQQISLSSLFVNTSIAEGFPNTFIQSWLRGVPVMSVRVNPNQVITKNNAGIIASDLQTMISVVHRLLLQPKEFYEYGLNGKKYAEAHYSVQNAEKLENLLEDSRFVH